MSTHDGSSRRRRIAGESKPSDAPRPGPAKKVVKKPVARPGTPATSTPGATPREETTPVEEPTTPVEESTTDAAAPEATPTEDRAADAADPAEAGTDADQDHGEDRVAAPRVAPRVARRQDRAAAATATDGETTTETLSGVPTEPSGPRGRLPLGRVLLLAMVVASLVFGAFFGYRGVAEWRQTHGVDGAHAQAAETAASAAETIFTYRYDQLDQYLEDSKDVMTPSFAKDFETISPALNDLAPQRKIQVEATTRDSAALPCGDDCTRSEAKVLLFVDQARLADGSQVPTVFGNRVELTMVERDGRWLVDDIQAL
ncbi:hypothetical protein [Aeromicrobium sp. 50.2.37]|uniref:hypothetical protein n=1 Tax=Aeromicrobium sp. 50.2.37 TaxID=2969305 RepID=UPI00214F8F09|nr:hypothetical protein [Aeromicrobium sp. 50.2.37]MCR4514333.1 hypothetical protein [Aeromicrobium sp. 50.2.37]